MPFPFFKHISLVVLLTFPWPLLAEASPDSAVLAREAIPGWVINQTWSPSEVKSSSSGFVVELKDVQVNLQAQATFYHEVYRITAKDAVEEGAKVDWDFDPAYQRVVFHGIKRWRAGQALDQSDLSFKKVQREERLDQAMYDGRQSWVGFLKDVKVGDTVELLYTVYGFNPVFDGRFFASYDIQSGSPRQRFFFRLTCPQGRELHWGLTPSYKLETSHDGTLTFYTVDASGVPGVPEEDRLPYGFDPFARIDVAEMGNWEPLVGWALKNYDFAPSSEVGQKAEELIQGCVNEGQKAQALLDFVQDQVRYLGIESDVNSYIPHAPQEVLKNLFGDCKDKAVLFCALARSVGLKAWPALVSSWRAELLSTDLPSPLEFDHAVAALELGGKLIWVDPTRSLQGGAVENRARDHFAFALLIRPGERGLTPLDLPPERLCEKEEVFSIKDFQSPVGVVAKVIAYGAAADDLRSYFTNQTPEDIRNYYHDSLRDRYGEVTLLEDPVGKDYRDLGRYEVSLKFRVEGFWQQKAKRKEFETYPHLVGEYLYDPKRITGRKYPYALEFPLVARQHQVFEMPEVWKVGAEDKTIQAPGFEVKERLQVKGKKIIVDSQYRSTADRVQVGDWSAYLENLKKSRTLLGWVFWKDQ